MANINWRYTYGSGTPEQWHRLIGQYAAAEARWPDERLQAFLDDIARRAALGNKLATAVAVELGSLADDGARRHWLAHLEAQNLLTWRLLTRVGE